MADSPSSSAQQARQALAKRLADLCRDAGLTGLDLADRCGWSRSKSSRIMNAKTPPSADGSRTLPQEVRCTGSLPRRAPGLRVLDDHRDMNR